MGIVGSGRSARSDSAIAEILPGLLAERGISLRALSAAIGVSPSHLSRALRGEEGKHISLDAVVAIAEHLSVPASLFREYRVERAVGLVRADLALANRIFEERCGDEIECQDAHQ
jgi:transcriptional regulator with XRE-family HTH domain